MFKAPVENDINILRCRVCDYTQSVPMHHNKPMHYILKGTFYKRECLRCNECMFEIDMPLHCNMPMIYSKSNYRDVKER